MSGSRRGHAPGARSAMPAEAADLAHLLAAGEMVPAQLPAKSFWSPEKALAAAVLSTALIAIRDHSGDPKRRRRVAEEIAWVRSDADDRLYAFLRVCELLNLDPQWVRDTAARWYESRRQGRAQFVWRGAA